jgi:shikimate dehydrogenase
MILRAAADGCTDIAGVIGDPVAHSLSPLLHNAAYEAAGLNWTYVAFHVRHGRASQAVDAMRSLGIRGLSVTMPHKEAVVEPADIVTPSVRAVGVANCLKLDSEGRVVAHNTDGDGFVNSYERHGDSIAGKSIAVIGAGGAARAVIEACGRAGAESVMVINRSRDRADRAAALAGDAGCVVEPAGAGMADIIVNATPVGMAASPGMPLDPALLSSTQTAIDLIYHPLETPWLHACARRGLNTENGLMMLLHQAAIQFTLWTGTDAPIDAMSAAYAEKAE